MPDRSRRRRPFRQAHPIPYRPVRQAHPRHRLGRRHGLSALAWAFAIAALSIGTALGSGSRSQAPAQSFRPADLSEVSALISPSVGVAAAADLPDRTDVVTLVSAAEPAGRACSPRLEMAAAPPTPTPTRAPAPQTQALAAFLGDSYTTGYNGFGIGAAGWPAIVSRSLDVATMNRAVAGTGFVNPGWTGQPIRTLVDPVIAANPRLVFLAAGHNDRSYGATAAMTAAGPVIDRLATALPRAILVILGPIWSDGNAPASLVSLDDQLRQKSGAAGATFIDPIRGGWFAGTFRSLISADGIHPTDAGHRHIADLVLAALRADARVTARLAPPASPQPPKPITEPLATTSCAL